MVGGVCAGWSVFIAIAASGKAFDRVSGRVDPGAVWEVCAGDVCGVDDVVRDFGGVWSKDHWTASGIIERSAGADTGCEGEFVVVCVAGGGSGGRVVVCAVVWAAGTHSLTHSGSVKSFV